MKFKKSSFDFGVRSMEAKEERCEVTIHAMANIGHKDVNSPKFQIYQMFKLSKATSLPTMRYHQICKVTKVAKLH
ncbi:hypothetical protein PVK06_017111 [Gossypium arboreum]|uniref:Uncharacterized protein n=1 Tax=Gossypium arboreum TaxID=29729 RepID=A0ABR0Q1T2_GOSAR|nr:hypothetical protein PVK06_017111 [Gossypium arboreum]